MFQWRARSRILPLQPKSKNDTWSEKELAAVLKQADRHAGKSSDGGREHGSRDRRSSSVKGQTTKEGGLGKKDAAVVLAKGEGSREQKNATATGSSKEKVRSHVLSV